MIDAKAIIEKYYPEGEARNILLTHSEEVRDLALEIVDNHPELEADREFVAEAAMLHDIGVMKVNAPRIGCHGELPYICHGYIGRHILEEEGLPIHALVCERHIGVGIKKKDIVLRNLPIPYRSMKPKTIEEKIICFADLYYSKSHLGEKMTNEVIERKLFRHGDDKVKKYKRWCKKFL